MVCSGFRVFSETTLLRHFRVSGHEHSSLHPRAYDADDSSENPSVDLERSAISAPVTKIQSGRWDERGPAHHCMAP